jgi:hypothetical protein
MCALVRLCVCEWVGEGLHFSKTESLGNFLSEKCIRILRPWTSTIKLFQAVIPWHYKLVRFAFVTSNFHPNLILTVRGGAYLTGALYGTPFLM